MGRRSRKRIEEKEKENEKDPIEYTLKNIILSMDGKYKHSIISNLSKDFLLKIKKDLILNNDI